MTVRFRVYGFMGLGFREGLTKKGRANTKLLNAGACLGIFLRVHLCLRPGALKTLNTNILGVPP